MGGAVWLLPLPLPLLAAVFAGVMFLYSSLARVCTYVAHLKHLGPRWTFLLCLSRSRGVCRSTAVPNEGQVVLTGGLLASCRVLR